MDYDYHIKITGEIDNRIVLAILHILERAAYKEMGGPSYYTIMGVRIYDILRFLIRAMEHEINEEEHTDG